MPPMRVTGELLLTAPMEGEGGEDLKVEMTQLFDAPDIASFADILSAKVTSAEYLGMIPVNLEVNTTYAEG